MSDSLFVTKPDSFDIGFRQNDKYWQVSNHYHNDYEIIYVVKGRLQFKIDDRVYTPKSDTLIFLNNNERHEYEILEYPYARHVIMVKPDFINSFMDDPLLTSIFQHRPANFNNLVELSHDQAPVIRELFNKMQFEYDSKSSFWETNVRLYTYLLLVEVFRISKAHFPLSYIDNQANKKLVTEVQKYIDDNYKNDINLKDISKQFHTDMYYLCHLFKEVTGFTFKSYLTMRRMSIAKDLLTYTDKDVTQVGFDSGFNNVNHFIRTFKKAVGITPFQYKKHN